MKKKKVIIEVIINETYQDFNYTKKENFNADSWLQETGCEKVTIKIEDFEE